jgi:transposase
VPGRGPAALVTRLQEIAPQLIVLEATGGYQRAVVAALAAAGLPVVVVNPRQARDFAKATGQLAKPDVLDARALAHCADARRPAPRPLPDAHTEERRALLARRRQLIAMRTMEQSRLGSAPHRLQADIQAHITWLNERLVALDNDLDTTLRASPVWREHEALLRRVPGIGPVCTRTLLLDLPELGDLEPPAHRVPRGRGALQSGQWNAAGLSDDLGWSCPCPDSLVHEYPSRGPVE